MQINRDNVTEQFTSYIALYDLSDTKIRLKAEHTCRVADLCDRIARSLAMPEEDVDLAWLLGMLHDIGRFEQVRRYGTFVDSQSVNHAEFGADLLFQEQLIRRFAASDAEDSLIERAIRPHNAFQLPADLSDRERTFAQILRDADKIDIVRVNCEFPRSEIYNLPEEAFLTSDISDQVLQDALSMQNVLRAHRQTAADYIEGQIALTFGLVYEESRRIIREQGYLDRVMRYESRNPETMRRLERIRGKVEQFLDGERFRIGVLSDTHGLLRQEVLEHLAGCDAILHGGDINRQEILDELARIAPVHVVRGNNDKEWAEHIPYTLDTEVCGLRLFMVHKKREIPAAADLTGTDLVVYGHSHKYEEDFRDGIRYLNPGSCGPRRFNQAITMALVHVAADGTFTIERIDIPHQQAGSAEQSARDRQVLDTDARALIEKVMADIDKGKGTAAIAKKYGISTELTETISRMYLTHPGVTADGIMTKMGL